MTPYGVIDMISFQAKQTLEQITVYFIVRQYLKNLPRETCIKMYIV
jgi:hypothetical protein